MSYSIAFLGPHGTFTEEALHSLLAYEQTNKGETSIIAAPSIPDTLEYSLQDKCDYAFVPIENSIEGSVNMTLDWFTLHPELTIQAELHLPIQQVVMCHPALQDCSPNDINTIYSHPHAVAQCQQFLKDRYPQAKWEYMKSTAEAAEWVSRHSDQRAVAVGNRWAASMNDLKILHEDIQDYGNNYTRFVLAGKEKWVTAEEHQASYKSSLLITLPEDYPGALYQVLAAFSWRKLNLTRIESRPTKKGLGSYYFFLDVDHAMDEVLLPGALAEIDALGCDVHFLGSYPSFIKKI
ncbi:prephenate dehydratase [Caldalkalibacillus salinus]|uniref:prephenate dehydratase n=1 Tax=Caldalkalibacillus salinus TaxID=2803787 RepID=UPI001921719B|nr:prephenate dehydratase [Caldalkalibacillus salinus]